jgi:hypothetical protein
MDRNESDALYSMTGSEALQWLESAQGLKHSAEVLRDHLIASTDVPPNLRRIETLGLMKSSMLLLGLAFENLIKGVYVAKNSEIVNGEKVNRSSWNSHGGHGIVDFAQAQVQLEADERELLTRLQEHILWAGRYPVPNKSSDFYSSRHPDNKRKLSSADFGLADRLFHKLADALFEARKTSA